MRPTASQKFHNYSNDLFWFSTTWLYGCFNLLDIVWQKYVTIIIPSQAYSRNFIWYFDLKAYYTIFIYFKMPWKYSTYNNRWFVSIFFHIYDMSLLGRLNHQKMFIISFGQNDWCKTSYLLYFRVFCTFQTSDRW